MRPDLKAILDANLILLGGAWRVAEEFDHLENHNITLESPINASGVVSALIGAIPSNLISSVSWRYWSGL